jgi:Flp pilus assembly protein TadD
LRIAPTDASAYYKRGVALAMNGELDRAASSYRTAIQFDPTLVAAHRQLAVVYDQLGDATRAAQQRAEAARVEEALRGAPPSDAATTSAANSPN